MRMLILATSIATLIECPGTLVDPVYLDKLSVHEAKKLDGLRVYVVFTIDSPPVEYNTETITGPLSTDIRVERAVHFPTRMANRLERQSGNRVRVFGTLRVIDYPATATAGLQLETWSVIRVENATLAP